MVCSCTFVTVIILCQLLLKGNGNYYFLKNMKHEGEKGEKTIQASNTVTWEIGLTVAQATVAKSLFPNALYF